MYATAQDLLKLIPEDEILQLADDTGAGSILAPEVAAVLAEAIDQAGREIDAHVGVVRPVPLSPVPALIANISAKLAVHNLYLRRANREEPDAWQRETSRCLRLLEAIATGKVALGATDGDQANPDGGSPQWVAPARVMGGMDL